MYMIRSDKLVKRTFKYTFNYHKKKVSEDTNKRAVLI